MIPIVDKGEEIANVLLNQYDALKNFATGFFRYWWNQKGNNTDQGFDSWMGPPESSTLLKELLEQLKPLPQSSLKQGTLLKDSDEFLLKIADKMGLYVDFSDNGYDGDKEAPMDRIGFLDYLLSNVSSLTPKSIRDSEVRKLAEDYYGNDIHLYAKQRDGYVKGYTAALEASLKPNKLTDSEIETMAEEYINSPHYDENGHKGSFIAGSKAIINKK